MEEEADHFIEKEVFGIIIGDMIIIVD